MKKEHWRNLFNEKYLGSWDLEHDGKFVNQDVTIERIYSDTFVSAGGKEQKAFIKLKEFQLPMVCNKSNFKRLENALGTFVYDDFIGRVVTLTVEKADNPNDRSAKVNALRFIKKVEKPELSEARLIKAIEAIKAGKITKESVLKDYKLDDSQLLKLDESC
jgi:hypothetical protein